MVVNESYQRNDRIQKTRRNLLSEKYCGTESFILYTYISAILQKTVNTSKLAINIYLAVLGIGSIIGNIVDEYSTDRWGNRMTLIGALMLLGITLVGSSMITVMDGGWLSAISVGIFCALWGHAGWAYSPALHSYLISHKPN